MDGLQYEPVFSVARPPVTFQVTGPLSFVSLEFLPSLPFRKQARFTIPYVQERRRYFFNEPSPPLITAIVTYDTVDVDHDFRNGDHQRRPHRNFGGSPFAGQTAHSTGDEGDLLEILELLAERAEKICLAFNLRVSQLVTREDAGVCTEGSAL